MKRRGEPIVPSKKGRKASFTEEDELQIVQRTGDQWMELNSLTIGSKGTLLDTMRDIIRIKRRNKHASFSTYGKSWSMLPSSSTVRSAFQKTGIFCQEKNGAYSPEVVMGHCPHWVQLPSLGSTATWRCLLGSWSNPSIKCENGYIPEESFNIFRERQNIDNSDQDNLNECLTNRQRCLLIGNNRLVQHQIMLLPTTCLTFTRHTEWIKTLKIISTSSSCILIYFSSLFDVVRVDYCQSINIFGDW